MELFFYFVVYYLLLEFLNKVGQMILAVSGYSLWANLFVDFAVAGITLSLLSGKSVLVKMMFLSACLVVLLRMLFMRLLERWDG